MKHVFIYLFSWVSFFPTNGQDTVVKKDTLNQRLPEVLWTFTAPAPIYASPVARSGMIYFGSVNGCFYAVNILNGHEEWKFETHGEIRSTALIHAGQIYFTNGSGSLFCLDEQNGRQVWKFTRPGEKKYPLYSFADYYQSSPTYYQGVVYFGSGNGNIYAVDAATGMEKWHFKTGDVVHSSPVVSGDKLFTGSFDGYFYALDLNGRMLWKFKSVGHRYFPKGEFQGSPAAYGSQVIVGARDYNLYAIDTGLGFCHWNLSFPKGWAIGQPVIHDSILYVGSSDDQLLMAIEPHTGKVLWQRSLKFNIFGGAAFGTNTLYIGTLMGKIFALDIKSGELRWTFETKAYKLNHLIYFNEDDTYKENLFGTVIRQNEDFLKMYYALGGIFSTPVKIDQNLIFSSTDGLVYCLKIE
ncbi:PQQ-binding-like beta-propeller repeat protein [Flavihumibacter fluvii]|uniref:outer membrane protein assembly factor BamB family protein n=1 Tax=Flavihumibacter fluvii TaxID=2838157 RepID=UPI001BDE8D96|nr:PQQ-binding-like beta-propeller repeat protein [Flavihumibacter fluvii]ULQ53952.1 PQQ-binding-like beta-propeller repeat protein [Flavihumibacter fluvii]